ncbi:hypothetical protein [Endozoicomonas sp. SESOKO4]|uniref:hypothetical protein n=1 Tax=Endozoicomonas sp. SESOKO4 TaxID=2828745 RepID=UPI00214945FC|nr:hypothetical protein [Endozoicomonas sp. SESOKO4]
MKRSQLEVHLALRELLERGSISPDEYRLRLASLGYLAECLVLVEEKTMELIAGLKRITEDDGKELTMALQAYLSYSYTLNTRFFAAFFSRTIPLEVKVKALQVQEVADIARPTPSYEAHNPAQTLMEDDHKVIQMLMATGFYELAEMAERNNAMQFIEYAFGLFEVEISRAYEAKASGSKSPEHYEISKQIIKRLSSGIWKNQQKNGETITSKGKMAEAMSELLSSLKDLTDWPNKSISDKEQVQKLSTVRNMMIPTKEYIQREWLKHAPDSASKGGRPKKGSKPETLNKETLRQVALTEF